MKVKKRAKTKQTLTVAALQKANDISAKAGLTGEVLEASSVGVQGDERTYKHVICLAGKVPGKGKGKISYRRLEQISTQLTNETPANRVIIELARKKK